MEGKTAVCSVFYKWSKLAVLADKETTHQLINLGPWPFFSSVRVLFLHEAEQSLLHDFSSEGSIVIAFFKTSSAEKCSAQRITACNIRPVYATPEAKKNIFTVMSLNSSQQNSIAVQLRHGHTYTKP